MLFYSGIVIDDGGVKLLLNGFVLGALLIAFVPAIINPIR